MEKKDHIVFIPEISDEQEDKKIRRPFFPFYMSFLDAIDEMDDATQLELYQAIAHYGLKKEDVPHKGLAKIAWALIKPNLDTCWDKHNNAGRPPKNNSISNSKELNLSDRNNSISDNEKIQFPNPSIDKDIDIEKDLERDKESDIDSELELDEDKRLNKSVSKSMRTRTAFVRPSLTEIQDFINQNSYNVDPNKFFYFYESNGWMVGKNKMKDWKASVRTWHAKENEKTDRQQPKDGFILKDINENKFNQSKQTIESWKK